MNLEQHKSRLYSNGFISAYRVRFDHFERTNGDGKLGLDDLRSIELVYPSQDHVYLFALEALTGEKGTVEIDLNDRSNPISIELIQALDLPNLSRLEHEDHEDL